MPSARPAHPTGPTALGVAVARVARMAIGSRHRETRDRALLAPPRLPPDLDVEKSAPSGSTRRSSADPHADSYDVGSESALGCTESPRRAREAGNRHQPGDGREIHGTPRASAVTDMATLPRQSCPSDRDRGLLRCAHRHVSTAVRAGDPGPGPSPHRPRRGYNCQIRGRAGQANPRMQTAPSDA